MDQYKIKDMIKQKTQEHLQEAAEGKTQKTEKKLNTGCLNGLSSNIELSKGKNYGNGIKCDSFTKHFSEGKHFIPCAKNKAETKNAGNLRQTELVDNEGETICHASRHAIAKTKAQAADLVKSEVLAHLSKMTLEELNDVKKIGLKDFTILSVSLVTPAPVEKWSGELGIQRKQEKAFKEVNNDMKNVLADIEIDGEQLKWSNVKVETCNFGVNEYAIGGGILQHNKSARAAISGKIDTKIGKDDTTKFDKIKLQSIKEKINDRKKYGQSGGRYRSPVLMLAAANLTDGGAMFNCKSGKDRTGMCDVMFKCFMARLDAAGDNKEKIEKAINMFDRELTADEKKENLDMLLNSGNLEVQEFNTTGTGYKTDGNNTNKMLSDFFGLTEEQVKVLLQQNSKSFES